ncbi:MAG: hypothetical protein LBD68_04335 [Zoogloeaceae bacterium]|jgi:hypothetical protein|nr:hypothetical protein [Zoogloeaceae bacterium]
MNDTPANETPSARHRYILGMRFDKAKVDRIKRCLCIVLYLGALSIHMIFITKGHRAFLDVYESFGISPPAVILFLDGVFRYWPPYALMHIGIFLYVFLYRGKNWPLWLILGLAAAFPIYYEISLSSLHLIVR